MAWWGTSTPAMPGSTGGAPQLLGGAVAVQLSKQVDSRAQSPKGPDNQGVGAGGSN